MILYKLRCVYDHEFEAWFRSSASYDEQHAAGDVECPYCSETRVSKAPMAPNVVSTSLSDSPKPDFGPTEKDEERAQDLARQILKAVDKLRDHVEENFEDVGGDFAKEARAIHEGEAEDRGIYGEASDDEAEDLVNEGVEFLRLPGRPRKNS